MRWLRPSLSPLQSILLDTVAGGLTAWSVMAVIATTPYWPHTCGTGVNDPIQYAFDLVPFGLRYLVVRKFGRPIAQRTARGFEVLPLPPEEGGPGN